MTSAGIWIAAGIAYAAFHAWYVGFRPKLTAAEVDGYCRELAAHWPPGRIQQVRNLLANDTGRQFFMANVLRMNRKTASGEPVMKVMERYQKPFLREILKRGCHPIAFARAASPAVECWGIDNADDWDFAAFVRYRSRRDLAETLVLPLFREIHEHKLEAVEKTFAFPGDPAGILFGGPRVVVLLMLMMLASLGSWVVG
jgi:hypothetical protein